ncbi:Lactate utilization protein A [Streptomyces aurantiogriseus]
MRVALFLTCVNDTLYPDTGRAVLKLLTRLGVEVDGPMAQTCCGQADYNTGHRHEADRWPGISPMSSGSARRS